MEPMIEEWEDWYASAGWPTTREYIDEEFYSLGMSPSDDLIVMEVSGMKGYNALQDYVNSLCPAPSDYRNTPTARHLHPDGTWSLVFVFRYENPRWDTTETEEEADFTELLEGVSVHHDLSSGSLTANLPCGRKSVVWHTTKDGQSLCPSEIEVMPVPKWLTNLCVKRLDRLIAVKTVEHCQKVLGGKVELAAARG